MRRIGSKVLALWVTAFLVGLGVCPVARAETSGEGFVWLEGEKPTASNVKFSLEGSERPFLSGDRWLKVSIEAANVEKELPAGGAVLEYAFDLAKDAKYEVWNRIGLEFARSPFQWRIDGGDWTTVSPEALTTDLMELGFWYEAAWLKLAEKPLSKGAHKFEIRLPKTKDEKGKTARVLYLSDAICIFPGHFRPNSKFKPNEDGRDARDLEAAKTTFQVPAPASASARVAVPLAGLWEVCRHDEQTPGETAKPITELPANPVWKAIQVPGDKNTLRPDLVFAHRLWYRTRVSVPESCAGRSFHLVFPQNNLNTTVYVNGVYCGFNNNPFARVQIDVTKGIKPGVNEVWVGIKDAWYGYSTNPTDPLKLRKKFNLPVSFFNNGFQDLAYPVWGHPESGILVTPELVVAGPGYVSDVFCKPSVARKELALDVTLSNPTPKSLAGELVCQAVDAKTRKVEKAFAARPFSLAAGTEQTLRLAEPWANPKLWWPDEPNLYLLRTVVKIDGKEADVSETSFGFREWTIDGKDFKLNGIVWHGWCDCFTADDKDSWLESYRKNHQRMMRFWGTSWQKMPPEEALKFFDRNGVVVRRSGMLDGEAIGYFAVENDADLKKLYGSEVKMDLMRNWQDQVVAQVKGERNHPSVMIWSIENEWLYINCINLYGGLMDQFEAEVKKVSGAVLAADPTRPTMTDGGGANKDQSMPVHGNHYVVGAYPLYPGHAYGANVKGGGRDRWVWDERRPRFIGEDFYITGNDPGLTYFGGEEAFQGKVSTRPAASLLARMLVEGYRWAEFGAWHLWMGQNDAPDQYVSYAPRAVFCRQWDWTFGSGQQVVRTLGIFNDTRFDDPITLTCTLSLGGKVVWKHAAAHQVPAGRNEKFDLTIPMPQVKGRQEGELVLSLSVKGTEVFREAKPVSILDTDFRQAKPEGIARLSAGELAVLDPHGAVAGFLKENGIPFTNLNDLANPPESAKILVIGKDALAEAESTSSRLAAYASTGRRVIVLEQKTPLKYQGIPAEIEAAANEGRTAFLEDLEHPIARNLRQKDFFTWSPSEVVYRDAYVKPTRGAKSLVQCHESLQNSALAEIPVGSGLLLVSQLLVGETLPANPVARQLLANLIDYAAQYRLEYRQVAACTGVDPQFGKTLQAIGLEYVAVADPLQAIGDPARKIAVITASPENLKRLAANLDKIQSFAQSGGWIVFHGLTPEGLADYNAIVGVEHMIRPFRRERVGFPAVRNRLMSGLTLSDVALYGSEQIFPWTAGNYVASDTFSYVVDYEDVAPFAKFPDDSLLNMVNGMVSADAWKYIVNVPAPEQGPLDWVLSWPKPQEIVEVEWIGNTFYWPVTRFELIFDGDARQAVSFNTKPNNDPQVFPVAPPRKGKDITLRLAEWQKIPEKKAVTGLDNLRLKARRSPEFYKAVRPMLNVGGLMEYPKGAGGVVLCNLLFKENEDVPLNGVKKRSVLTALLRNLRAPFAGGKSVIAGANLAYEPIDLSKQANQFRDERGWFGDKKFTFKDLPVGRQNLAGVPFQIFEFKTSPVPTVVMLGAGGIPNNPAPEVRGIPVNRKADALFFLHTARLDARMNRQEIKEKKRFEMLRYVVTYADGKTENVPVYAEIDIDDYRQEKPRAIPGAQIAWTKPFEGTPNSAVAYSKQWNNPRPEVEIKSIDMVYGPERRGVPVLIAVTAASAK